MKNLLDGKSPMGQMFDAQNRVLYRVACRPDDSWLGFGCVGTLNAVQTSYTRTVLGWRPLGPTTCSSGDLVQTVKTVDRKWASNRTFAASIAHSEARFGQFGRVYPLNNFLDQIVSSYRGFIWR